MNNEIKIFEDNKIIDSDWYKLLVDDCGAIITETRFEASWRLLEGYHELGERILEDISKFEDGKIYGKQIVKMISNSICKSERTIYNAIKFAEKFPDINSLPEGKNITWSKMCRDYLPDKITVSIRNTKRPLFYLDRIECF